MDGVSKSFFSTAGMSLEGPLNLYIYIFFFFFTFGTIHIPKCDYDVGVSKSFSPLQLQGGASDAAEMDYVTSICTRYPPKN